jgi:hypothetical protein
MEIRLNSRAPEHLEKGAAALEAAFAAGRLWCGVAHVAQHAGGPDPAYTDGCLVHTDCAGIYEVRPAIWHPLCSSCDHGMRHISHTICMSAS